MVAPVGNASLRRETHSEPCLSRLLDAASDLFVEKGYSGTRLDDVARRAAVSDSVLRLHFSNKEELFEAVRPQIREFYDSLIVLSYMMGSTHP